MVLGEQIISVRSKHHLCVCLRKHAPQALIRKQTRHGSTCKSSLSLISNLDYLYYMLRVTTAMSALPVVPQHQPRQTYLLVHPIRQLCQTQINTHGRASPVLIMAMQTIRLRTRLCVGPPSRPTKLGQTWLAIGHRFTTTVTIPIHG